MPWSIDEPSAANPRQQEASPLASRPQASLALAPKLVGQPDLLPFGVAEDVRTKFAGVTVVNAKDLFPTGHGSAKEVVNWAWHGVCRLAALEHRSGAAEGVFGEALCDDVVGFVQ